ncbi:Hsp20/alpha crystallin family protein [Tundrisphaera lichenicola]|uniref:Hsp20/alpha crystallin family protein n=1 Tax=Tundrisphaera lichenicola TaxID=2029860 RepID=UPI003EC11661
MLPITRNSQTPVAAFPANRMDVLFNRVFGEDDLVNRAWTAAPIAMWADDDHIWVEAEMPGMAESDVEITVHRDTLIIKGERKAEEGRRYLYNGRAYGRFERAVSLPEAVNAEAVKATLKDGVLRVELPKSIEAKPRRISISSS